MDRIHQNKNHTKRLRWTPEDIIKLQEYPSATAEELALILGRTVSSIEHARQRFGRYRTAGVGLCGCCGERIVWAEQSQAVEWGLCKGCYLREVRMREDEEREASALRQRRFKRRKRENCGQKAERA